MGRKQSDEEIKWAVLTGFQKEFVERMRDGRECAWFWMHLSGVSRQRIAEEYRCSQRLVYDALQKTISRYNEEVKRYNEALSQGRAGQTPGKQTAAKPSAETGRAARNGTAAEQKQERYRPKKQNRQVYRKLKDKILKQFDKKFYLGDIRITDAEYEELLEYARFRIRGATSNSLPLKDDPILAVALVQIGIRRYDGNYWTNALKGELHASNTQPMQRFLGESFIQTLKRHGKYILKESERVHSILFHAFVTDFYSKGLFELLFQYYSKDLERDINRNDKLQMQALMETLRLTSEGNEEESEAFTEQFTGRGSRAYKLRLHTLQAISANPAHSSMRLRHILRLMDKAFWRGSVPQKPVSRLTVLFKDWLRDSPSFNEEYRLYQSGEIRNRGKKHFSSPYLFADIRNTRFSLVLPPQIVRPEDAENLSWRYWIADELLEVPVEAYQVLTGFKTEELRLPVPTDRLFSRVRCQLCADDEPVRSFPELPETDLRLFDMEGDYADRLFKIPMCAYTGLDYQLKSPALTDRVPLGALTRWELEFANGDVLILPDGKSMVAGERYGDGLTLRGVVDNAALSGHEEDRLPVYERVPDLMLTLPREKIPGTVLDVNGTRHQLSECERDEFDALDSRGARAFLISLRQFLELRDTAENHIILDVPGAIYAKPYSFVLISGFRAVFDGAPYVFAERGVVLFPDGLEVRSPGSGMTPLRDENGFRFPLSPETRTLPIRVRDRLDLELTVPLFLWSFDREHWSAEPMGDVWHTELLSNRAIYCLSPDPRVEFSMDDDYDGDDEAEQRALLCEKREGFLTLDLTRFRSWITRDRPAYRITMRMARRDYDFATVFARSYVTFCDLSADYESDQLLCTAEFIGKSDYYVDVTHLPSKTRVAEKLRITDDACTIEAQPRNGEYLVELFETETEDDYFEELSYYPIHSFRKTLFNRNDLSGNHLRVLSFRPMSHSQIHPRLASPLWVRELKKSGPLTYEGRAVGAEWNELPVRVVFPSQTELRYFHLYFMDEEVCTAFLFDADTKRLVTYEEPGLLYSVRYRRYAPLFDDEYLFYGSLEKELAADET